MKLVILGATGPTGQCLMQHALAAGHEVIAVVRNAKKISEEILANEKFSHVTGDIFSADSLKPCLENADVILSCLGLPGTTLPFTTVSFYSESIKAIVGAMKQSKSTARLIVMSSWCSKYEPSNPKFVEWIFKPLMIGRHLDDMYRMEQFLESEKSLDYVVVRPPGLLNKPSSDKKILAEEGQFIKNTTMGLTMGMPRSDVAKFMLACATDDTWKRKCVAIAI